MLKTYCITLPETPDATIAAQKHFAERGVEDVEFVWGLHAEIAGLATAHTYERDNPGTNFRMGYKCTGIWLAHWLVWQIAMRTDAEYIMVLEADAKFDEDWKEKFDDAMKHVPKGFGFLHLGHCAIEGHPKAHIGGNVYESKHAQCAHCYIVQRSILPFMLKTIRKCYAPIDIALLLEIFPFVPTYVVVPRIVSQFNTIIPP